MFLRPFLLLGALAALSTGGGAQRASARGVEANILSHQALVRTALGNLLPPERSVSQLGLELSLPSPWRVLRAEGRLLSSVRGAGDLQSLDAGLVVGLPGVAVAAQYAIRASYDPATGLAHGRNYGYGRLGLRLRSGEPHTLFTIHLRGDAYLPTVRADLPADEISGWDAEGGITYRTRQLPLTASIGYRLERFRVFSVKQEVSALTFALGLAFGGR